MFLLVSGGLIAVHLIVFWAMSDRAEKILERHEGVSHLRR